MTQVRCLIINFLATFSRTLYVTICGLLTGRWLLKVLGDESYGLLVLVGGLISFISIFSSLFSSSISRYYAFSIGEAQKKLSTGVNECRAWFNVALFIHIVLPLLILFLGYPIGAFCIKNYLNIPLDRINDCIWIFRFSCISCFVGLAYTPFYAMFIAKQRIAELTIYTFINTTLYLVVLFYMLIHPRDWLLWVAFWMKIQILLPALIVTVRAIYIFPECRISIKEMFNFTRMKTLFSFAGWKFLGNIGFMLQTQLNSIFVNLFLGPAFNASNAVAYTLSGRVQNFSNEIDSVFAPAVVTNYGANKKEVARKLAYMCSKYSILLMLLFVIPLSLEIKTVINVWLGDPPQGVYGLSVLICASYLLSKFVSGDILILNASGKIAQAQILAFLSYLSCPFMAFVSFYFYRDIFVLGCAILVSTIFLSISFRFSSLKEGCSLKEWYCYVLKPTLLVAVISFLIGYLLVVLFQPSILRCFIVGFGVAVSLILSSWFFALSFEEKEWIKQKVKFKILKLK